jgi:signal transduction histidine kinase
LVKYRPFSLRPDVFAPGERNFGVQVLTPGLHKEFWGMNNSRKWKIFSLLLKVRWIIIVAGAMALSYLEYYESHYQMNFPVHSLEYVVYTLFLGFIGFLVELVLRANRRQDYTMQLLDYKHKLSLELADLSDWDELAPKLAKLPVSVAPVVQKTCLYARNPLSGEIEFVAQWPDDGQLNPAPFNIANCARCVAELSGADQTFTRCYSGIPAGQEAVYPLQYCISLKHGKESLGVLHIQVEAGQKLTVEQKEIFRNIGDELGHALKRLQERKLYVEMQNAETALAERRIVSHYLHDHLGQNLAYLHLKLDQLANEKGPLVSSTFRADLETMRNAANEAYEIVRGNLEIIQPETMPILNNLLVEHAKRVAQRAGFTVRHKSTGKPVAITTDEQRAVFYIFQEALSNVEKHAKASHVEVLVNWDADNLQVSIADNGRGFDPELVNVEKHFGLQIIRERIEKVNGHLEITSRANSGTLIKVSLPLLRQIEPEKLHEISHE